MNKRQLNTILITFCFLCLFTLTSCLPDKKDDNVGYNIKNPIPVTELVNAFYRPFMDVNLLDKNFGDDGEYVLYGLNSRFNSQTDATLISDHLARLKNIREEATEFIFTYEYVYDNYHDDQELKVVDVPFPFDKESGAQNKPQMLAKAILQKNFINDLVSQVKAQRLTPQSSEISFEVGCTATENRICVLFFDLQIAQTSKQAPQPFIERGCVGLPGCALNVTQLKYKQVVRILNQPEQVTGHVQEFSPQIPFISPFSDDYFNDLTTSPLLNGSLSHCYDFWIPQANGSNIFAKQCTYLKDFSYGTMNTAP